RQSDGATAVDENGTTDSYTVQLRTAPTANVTITLNTTNQQVLTSATSLVFTPANWNLPQTVTVSAVDDQLGESGAGLGIVRHTVSSADGNYNNRAVPDLRVAVTDNDLYIFLPNFVAGDTNPFGISGGGSVAAVPVLADLDADGDLDAVIGYDDGSLKYFRNTSGNSDAPNFVLQVGDLGLGTGGSGASPTLGDLDGDGDLDAIVGLTSGALRLLRNTGTATAPAFTLDTTDIGLATADASVRPALVDIDADGDLDLVVGTSVGTLRLHRNTGSASAPQFTLVANNYGPGTIGASARPTFADIDGDGDFDAAIGDQDGVTHLLLNVGTAQDASFQQTFGYGLPSTPNVTFSAAPAFGDIDTDGDVDLLVGNLLGGTRLYLNDSGLDMPALDPIEFTDTPLDDVFAVRTSRARGSGADNQVMTYGLQGGTDNGTTVSLVDPLGTLSLHKTTGVASFSPVGGAINALSGPQSLAYTVTFTDGQSAAVANLEVRFLQIGTTESTGNNNL
ncbi:MAG: VCBS repeat-containing protein, partial [Rhodoferax sp.]|nr:VCBS repeat-containing protein [Rhodoferax sp.]